VIPTILKRRLLSLLPSLVRIIKTHHSLLVLHLFNPMHCPKLIYLFNFFVRTLLLILHLFLLLMLFLFRTFSQNPMFLPIF